MNVRHIYPGMVFSHNVLMQDVISSEGTVAAGDQRSLRSPALCGLALTVSFLAAAPALAQSSDRIDIRGSVQARCSAVSVSAQTISGLRDGPSTNALTVRCSGPRPALSVRSRLVSDEPLTLSVASVDQAERLSTAEGNVVIGDAGVDALKDRLARNPAEDASVEIVVAPAL